MEIEKRNIKKQLFICTNQRDEGECCFFKGSLELVSRLKNRLKDQGLWKQYKVTKSGCLGPCKQGISAVLHPDNVLITKIRPEDEDELYELLLK